MAEKGEERRIFKRYRKDTEFILNIDSKPYNCRTIDYSAEGICLHFVDAVPTLLPNKIIEIKIEDPEIDFHGEVVWTKDTDPGLIVGFRRVGNIKGTCQDFRLPDILIGLQRSTKTGILELITGSKITKIFIKNGDMIFANSSHEDDRFGEVLLKEGKITLKQYFEASEILKETGKRLGQVLVNLGYLKSTELIRAVQRQVEEIIVNLLIAECGYFEFKEGPLPSDETITLNLSAANLIYRGVKRISNFQFILQDFPSLDTALSLSQDPIDLFQDLNLDDSDKEIFSHVRGDSTIGEILSSSPLSDFETIKTLYALLCSRVIGIKVKGETTPSVSPEEVVSEPLAEIDAEFVKMVEDMYDAHTQRTYYEMLGLKQYASNDEVKKAYFRLAKEFHPDRHFSLPSEDLKRKLHELFSHVTEAYNTLSNAEERKEYDKTITAETAHVSQDSSGSKTDIADERFDDGRTKMTLGLYSEAEKLFAQAIHLDNSQPSYHYYHGLALNKLNIFKEAVRSFENAIKLNPRKAHYFAALGYSFLKLGFKKRAESNFKKALEISPANKTAIEGMRQISG